MPLDPHKVIDVEGTLCTSYWDPKYGWRYALRPGVKRFLTNMCRYYELVLFSSSPSSTGELLMEGLKRVRSARLSFPPPLFDPGLSLACSSLPEVPTPAPFPPTPGS